MNVRASEWMSERASTTEKQKTKRQTDENERQTKGNCKRGIKKTDRHTNTTERRKDQ